MPLLNFYLSHRESPNEWMEEEVPFRSVLDPEDIAMLTKLLNDHCSRHGIRSAEARESVAASLLAHYQNSTTDEHELRDIIQREDDPELR